ncbi:MAG: thioredoxin domain-containing protein [Vicinamibacterales bacterium]
MASILMGTAALLLIWRFVGAPVVDEGGRPAVPTEAISIAGTPTFGDVGAAVVMIGYSDFRCPFCARFASQVLPVLREEYVDTGRLRFAFKHLPLSIHPFAGPAARVAECAARQGRFWAVHDALFTLSGQPFDLAAVTSTVQSVGVDSVALTGCLADDASEAVQRDQAEAARLGIASTPYFLIGHRQDDGRVRIVTVVKGAAPVSEFRRAIERVRDEAQGTTR